MCDNCKRSGDALRSEESDAALLHRLNWKNNASGDWVEPQTGFLWNEAAAAQRARRIENDELARQVEAEKLRGEE